MMRFRAFALLGLALLAFASLGAAQTRVAKQLAPEVLDRYVGKYQLGPEQIFTVWRQGPRLFAQLADQQGFEIFAASEQDFFYKVVDAQLHFEKPKKGKSPAVVLHQHGKQERLPRIEETPAAEGAVPKSQPAR
jgi:hypothetical protein